MQDHADLEVICIHVYISTANFYSHNHRYAKERALIEQRE